MEIVACRASDVEVLERVAPTGLNRGHEGKYARQVAGLCTYLVAWRDGEPVAHGELRWEGCASPTVQAAVPDCPELNGLLVYRDDLRGQGIGTAIIRVASMRAWERGCPMIGLGVGADNPRAANLYRKLGFVPTVDYLDVWSGLDDNGVEHQFEDPCTFLVKDFAVTPPR